MKKLLFVLFILGSSLGYATAQEAELSDVRSVKYTDFGAMKNGEELEGYYTFYMVHKSKKSQSYDKKHFDLVLFDTNLKETKRIEVLRPMNSDLHQAAYNGKSFMFIFSEANGARLNYETLFYNKDGEKIGGREYSSKSKGLFFSNAAAGVAVKGAISIPKTGFALLKFSKDLGYQTTIACLDHRGETKWETKQQRKKAYSSHNLLFANEDIIVSMYSTRAKMLSTAVASFIQIISTETGKVLSEERLANNINYLLPLGASYDPWTEEVILYGEYYAVKKNGAPNIKEKKGIFFRRQKKDGTKTGEEFASWEKSINPKMAKNASVKKGEKRSVVIHDVISKKGGGFYVIGEQFNKVVSAGGVALKVLAGQNSNASVMKIAIYDMLVMDFDGEMKLQKIDVVEKHKVNAQLAEGMGMVNEEKLAYFLKLAGVFDYRFTTLSNDGEDWSVTYVNFDRKAEGIGTQKTVIGSICEDKDGEIEINKHNIADHPDHIWVAPAIDGNTALFKYYKKEREAKILLVK